jgi:carboxyl-terminal processing protease
MFVSRRGNQVIVFPLPGTPASRAGIFPRDVLIAVDTVDVTGERDLTDSDLQRITSLVRGDSGTVVNLIFERHGVRVGPLSVRREPIVIRSVQYAAVDSAIGYVRVFSFSDSTASEFGRAMDSLRVRGTNRFIIDLRHNGGGLMDQALRMAELFSPTHRDLLVTLSYRQSSERLRAEAVGPFAGSRVVILTDGFTASASEIFAGILQDWGVAQIVGEPTFGKGVAQTVVPLWQRPDGSPAPDSPVIILTNLRYLVGNGARPVTEENPLQPNYLVAERLTREEADSLGVELQRANPTQVYFNPRFDPQLRRAIELLRARP